MRFLIPIIFFLSFPCVIAQSALPQCPQSGLRHNCQGEHVFPSGNIYRGEWKDGKFDGPGEMTFPSGNRLTGYFSDSGRKVVGTLNWPSGAKHVGEFLMGRPHGNGTRYRSDGSVALSGIWKDGVLEGSPSQSIQSTPVQNTPENQKWAEARSMCENFGFTPNTNPFAECVQREAHKQAATASRTSEDDSRRAACQQRNSAIESRVKQCRSSCDSTARQAMLQIFGASNIRMVNQINNQRDACYAQCDMQLSMKGEC